MNERHVKIAQDVVMLDDMGSTVVGRYASGYQKTIKGEQRLMDVSNIITIHQSETVDDGILFPARSISLGHLECDRLRTALNRWMVDPDKVTVDRATLNSALELLETSLQAENWDEAGSMVTSAVATLRGILDGVQA